MTLVKVQISSMNHYQLLRLGLTVELIEYGPSRDGEEHTGRRLLATMKAGQEVIWECDPGGTKPERMYFSRVFAGNGEIVCGDDFIRGFEKVEDITRWKLWVDDQLDDPDQPQRHVPSDFWGATNIREAQELVEEYGPPYFMDLDCDLGENEHGLRERVIDFLKWLQENYPESPPSWQVHSENGVAKPAVDSFMASWHKVSKKSKEGKDPMDNLQTMCSECPFSRIEKIQ